MTTLPADFVIHPRLNKIMQERMAMIDNNTPMDWGCAETLAYATLLQQGVHVRISGQDVARGTFGHRHAVLHDQVSTQTYTPLQHLAQKQGRFTIIDSLLSEEAVLAFEYGYSRTMPNTLVIWEAQFGDFCNGAASWSMSSSNRLHIGGNIHSNWAKARRIVVLRIPGVSHKMVDPTPTLTRPWEM